MTTKQGGSAAEALAQATAERGQIINQQLLDRLKVLGLVSAGLGLGVRGAQGVFSTVNRNTKAKPRSAYAPPVIDIPVPRQPDEEKEAGFLQGSWASDVSGHPLAIPGSIAVGAGGLYGGWKLMDYLLNKQRKSESEQEVASAKKDFEKALLEQYKPASALNQDLDELATLIEKRAWTWGGDLPGWATGVALTGMGGIGLLSGLIAHHIARKHQSDVLTRKAYQRHQRAVQQMRGSPIYARPVPMPVDDKLKSAPNEDEMEGDPLDKEAAGIPPVRMPQRRQFDDTGGLVPNTPAPYVQQPQPAAQPQQQQFAQRTPPGVVPGSSSLYPNSSGGYSNFLGRRAAQQEQGTTTPGPAMIAQQQQAQQKQVADQNARNRGLVQVPGGWTPGPNYAGSRGRPIAPRSAPAPAQLTAEQRAMIPPNRNPMMSTQRHEQAWATNLARRQSRSAAPTIGPTSPQQIAAPSGGPAPAMKAPAPGASAANLTKPKTTTPL